MNTDTNPRLLRSDGALSNTAQIGFRIVLPTPVTALGFQVMSYNPKTVSVNINGTPVSGALGPYPTGTSTSAALGSKAFFGITSTTTFQTIDIISTPGSGNTILIDNLVFGTQSSGAPAGEIAEPQTAVFLLTGLGMMLLAHRMRNRRMSPEQATA